MKLKLVLTGSPERKFCSKALGCFSIKAALLRELAYVGVIVLTCVKESNICDAFDRPIMRNAITNSGHLVLEAYTPRFARAPILIHHHSKGTFQSLSFIPLVFFPETPFWTCSGLRLFEFGLDERISVLVFDLAACKL